MKQLLNKRALITGANRGIGKVIAETFAAEGASLLLCARAPHEEFSNFIDYLKQQYNCEARALYFDLGSEDEIKAAIKPIIQEKIPIDILVNNAGIAQGGFMQMTSIQNLRHVFEINFFSQIAITQLVVRAMAQHKKGSIINMASIAGMDSRPGYTAYGSSKAALIFATKTISQELASQGIRVNAVAPALTETEMANQMEIKAKQAMIEQSAMNRLANPQEIANVVLFLASDLSSFINGQVIRVDGGM